jgi:hypothetical protein
LPILGDRRVDCSHQVGVTERLRQEVHSAMLDRPDGRRDVAVPCYENDRRMISH